MKFSRRSRATTPVVHSTTTRFDGTVSHITFTDGVLFFRNPTTGMMEADPWNNAPATPAHWSEVYKFPL